MILVATTTLGIPARSIYSRFFTSSASQVGLAIVMREIYRYIYLFLFPTKRSYRHPRLKFHSKFLARSLESIAISNSYPSSPLPWQTTLHDLTSRSQSRRLIVVSRGSGGGKKGKGSFGRTFFSVLPPDATTRKGKRRILVLLFTGATWTLERGRRR